MASPHRSILATPRWVWWPAFLALVLFGLAPLGVMLARVAGDPGALTEVLSLRTLSLLGRTLMLGLGVVGVALLLGIPYGYLVARTNVRGRGLWSAIVWVPLCLPPLIMAMTWAVLSDVRGAPMTIWILGLGHFPLVAVFVAKAARRIDARQVEAARLVGGWSAQWRMEWPLIWPGAMLGALLAFVFAINDFAVPDYVSSVGPKFNVYADEVFATWQVDQKDSLAVATALPLIALTLFGLVAALKLRRKGSLASLASGFQTPPTLDLGRWRLAALGWVSFVVFCAVVLPIGRLLYEAGLPLPTPSTGAAGPGATATTGGGPIPQMADVPWSLSHTIDAFGTALERCRDNLRASILLAIGGATLAVPVAFGLAHRAARAPHGKLWLFLCILPFAAPAILFGIGQIVVWNHDWSASFYTGDGLVMGMLMGRYLAFAVLGLTSAVENVSPRLEEAAALVGAGPGTRLWRVVAPPILPNLVGAWTMVFVFAMRELDAAILVPAANKTVMFRLYNAVHFYRQDYVAALALVTLFVILIPGLLWALFARRRMEVLS